VWAAAVSVDNLRSIQAALVAAERDYQVRAGSLSATERVDFSDYLEHLHQRLNEGCKRLRRAGIELPGDLACPQGVTATVVPTEIDLGHEQTTGEHTRSLDTELQRSLGEFDEKLLQEQARVRAQAPGSAASRVSGGAGGESANGTAEKPGSRAAGKAAGGSSGPTQQGSAEAGQSTVNPPGTGRPTPVSKPPADIPDGSDDDVVARQLREAAEQERDPELQKKLWDEYRKYKRGTR